MYNHTYIKENCGGNNIFIIAVPASSVIFHKVAKLLINSIRLIVLSLDFLTGWYLCRIIHHHVEKYLYKQIQSSNPCSGVSLMAGKLMISCITLDKKEGSALISGWLIHMICSLWCLFDGLIKIVCWIANGGYISFLMSKEKKKGNK